MGRLQEIILDVLQRAAASQFPVQAPALAIAASAQQGSKRGVVEKHQVTGVFDFAPMRAENAGVQTVRIWSGDEYPAVRLQYLAEARDGFRWRLEMFDDVERDD